MKCSNCNNEIEDGVEVCPNCGFNLEENQNSKEKPVTEVNQGEYKEAEIVTEKTNNQTEDKGFSIASLVLGISSFVCIAMNTFLALLCSILAIIFGVIGRKKGAKGMGTAGMILGIIGTVIIVLIIILAIIIAFSAYGHIMNNIYY